MALEITQTNMEIDSRESLKRAMAKLQEKQRADLAAIKTDLGDVYESLKPVHVVQALVSEVFHSPEIRKNLFQSALGYGAGFLAQKIVAGKSRNPFKRALGYLAQVGVTNIVNSNSEEIQSKGTNLVERLIKRYKSHEEETTDNDTDN